MTTRVVQEVDDILLTDGPLGGRTVTAIEYKTTTAGWKAKGTQ